jgi:hypothetical protein
MGITRQSTQSPAGYSAANLQGPQLATRIGGAGMASTIAAAASAAVRGNINTALQDSGFRYKIHPSETICGLVDADLTFGYDPGDWRRYGADSTGAADSSAAIQQSFVVAAQSSAIAGSTAPAGAFKLTTTVTAGMKGVGVSAISAPGAAYTNGTYLNVPLTGGSGTGAIAKVTVAGGAVTAVRITQTGTGYAAADVLSCLAAAVGGTGAGFTLTVTNIVSNVVNVTGQGKFISLLIGTGFGANVPFFSFNGTTGARIDAMHCDNIGFFNNGGGTPRAIIATWVINSRFDNLYFYQVGDGWVGSSSFGNGFRNNNSFGIVNSVYILGVNCNGSFFSKTRFASAGAAGVSVNGTNDTLVFLDCDFEGVPNGISLLPPTGSNINNVLVSGCHFENINGTAINALGAGVDPISIQNLVIKCNTFTGGFAAIPNALAVNAIKLGRVDGFEISDNNFTDWGTADSAGGGTQGFAVFLNGGGGSATVVNGLVARNKSFFGSGLTLAVQNLADVLFASSVEIANNFVGVHGTGYLGYSTKYINLNEVNPAPSVAAAGTFTFDCNTGSFANLTVNGATFTVANPTNGFLGRVIEIRIKNASGGASVPTFGGLIKQAFTMAATGSNRTIRLEFDGTNWNHVGGTFADVPN